MSNDAFYDEGFAQIAQRAGNVQTLLDEFFAFLHRRTDFYVEFEPVKEDEKKAYSMGFPKGYAESMVANAFKKYPMKNYEEERAKLSRQPHPPAAPANKKKTSSSTANTTTTSATKAAPTTPTKSSSGAAKSPSSTPSKLPLLTADGKQIPIGNGGVADNYYWTQTLKDLTIYTDIPVGTKGKEVQCTIKASSISLAVKGEVVFEGALEETVKTQESMWTISKGNDDESPQLVITLEKVRETWWKHVVVGHPQIDTTKVDSTKNIHEYDQETQATIRKIMFEQRQKMLGEESAPAEKSNIDALLAEASKLPGSPFSKTSSSPLEDLD